MKQQYEDSKTRIDYDEIYDIKIELKDDTIKIMIYMNQWHQPLCYHLIFIHGTRDYHTNLKDITGKSITMNDYYRFHL